MTKRKRTGKGFYRDYTGDRKEFRVGIGGWTGQGMYILAKSKREAYRIAINDYMIHYNATRERAKELISMSNVRVWRNVDGSVPAWRRKKS